MREHAVSAMVLTALSGLSTGLGGVLVVCMGSPGLSKLGHFLSFSAGVMVYISFLDMLPQCVTDVGFFLTNVFFLAGAVAFLLVGALFPDPSPPATKVKRGSSSSSSTPKEERASLVNLGLVTAAGISLHNFPEGMAVYLGCLARGPVVGLPLACAIAVHNIPEGMAVAAPLWTATGSKWMAVRYSLLSGLCEPLGALVVALFAEVALSKTAVQASMAVVAGIMVSMCIKELLPATFRYIKPERAAYSFILGMAVIFVTVHLLQTYL